jgi:CarboxypepD_reg-like domain
MSFKSKSLIFNNYLLFFIFLGFWNISNMYSQTNDDRLIQFSGVVVTGDSLSPVPFANVMTDNSRRGTMTDYYGYFSFVAKEGDIIWFSAVGFKRSKFTIPYNLPESRYSMIQILNNDTIQLQETVIYPWPTREQFKEAFLNVELPVTDFDRAQSNLQQEELAMRMEQMPASGAETFKFSMQNVQSKLYYAGQAPPISIFNPFAWAKFIESWRNGDFKRKDTN